MKKIITNNGIKIYDTLIVYLFNIKICEYVGHLGTIKFDKKLNNYYYEPSFLITSIGSLTISNINKIIVDLQKKHIKK